MQHIYSEVRVPVQSSHTLLKAPQQVYGPAQNTENKMSTT